MSDCDKPLVTSHPEVLGGVPVFAGTRVPVRSLPDFLQSGCDISEFLENFPDVTREQVMRAMKLSRDVLMRSAMAVDAPFA